MRFANELDHHARAHALLRLNPNTRFLAKKEMDAHEHVGERQPAPALDGAVRRGGGIATPAAVLTLRLANLRPRHALDVEQVSDRLPRHANAVVLHHDLHAVVRLHRGKDDRERLGLAHRVLDAVFQ